MVFLTYWGSEFYKLDMHYLNWSFSFLLYHYCSHLGRGLAYFITHWMREVSILFIICYFRYFLLLSKEIFPNSFQGCCPNVSTQTICCIGCGLITDQLSPLSIVPTPAVWGTTLPGAGFICVTLRNSGAFIQLSKNKVWSLRKSLKYPV